MNYYTWEIEIIYPEFACKKLFPSVILYHCKKLFPSVLVENSSVNVTDANHLKSIHNKKLFPNQRDAFCNDSTSPNIVSFRFFAIGRKARNFRRASNQFLKVI